MPGTPGESSVNSDPSSSSVLHEGEFQPLSLSPNLSRDPEGASAERSRSRQSSRSLERTYTLSDGYSHHVDDDEEMQQPPREKEGPSGDEEFVVKWDGPDDPDNPRNMSLFRRWVVVMVISLGSACVYVRL